MRILLIFSNFVYHNKQSLNISIVRNLYANFVEILDICKKFSKNLVDERGNVPRRGVVPRFSDLDVIALSLTAEKFSIDSESLLFSYLQEYKDEMPDLISRRQFNDRRKFTANLCEQIRKNMAMAIDEGEDVFCVDSKPIPVCRIARAKRCKLGRGDFQTAPSFGYCAAQTTYYYGYKMHAVCGIRGVIHSYELSKANVHDLHYLNDIKHDFHDCTIIGDKGYLSASMQLDLFETANIHLEVPYRLNQKDCKPTFVPFAKARKRVETLFSQMVEQFMICRNYTKQQVGLFARVIS